MGGSFQRSKQATYKTGRQDIWVYFYNMPELHRGRNYYLFYKVGKGGWYSEIKKGSSARIPIPIPKPVPDADIEMLMNQAVPKELRIQIPDKL
jgi:hypothetical protein